MAATDRRPVSREFSDCEPGRVLETCMERTLLRRFENWFQQDLSSLRIFFLPDTTDIAVPGSKAFSVGTHVYLAHAIASATVAHAQYLLAHEIAHVVQRIRARVLGTRVASSAMQLEHEANAAATAFITGGLCPHLSPDIAMVPRAWGPSGHYYTVYAVGRHAGLSDPVAEQLAFFAQLPDQVSDLDAIVAGEGFVFAALMPPAHRHAAMADIETTTRTSETIHCLNGKPGGRESDRRLAILKGIDHLKETRGRFAFGLGLHALGDSFSHRTGETDHDALYTGPYGHLFGGTGFVEKIWKLGKDVDSIAVRGTLYKQYCEALFTMLREKFGSAAPVVSKPGTSHDPKAKGAAERPVDALVTSVVNEPTEEKQIARLLRAFPDKSSGYRPETENCMPWRDFLRAHPKETAPWMPGVARQLMDRWV